MSSKFVLATLLGILVPQAQSHPPKPVDGEDTAVTRALNAAIQGSAYPDVYKKGKGILVRSPFDGFASDATKKVVPATFWVNDIFAPSQLYPGSGGGQGNPWCPTSTTSCPNDPATGDNGPWNYLQMGLVINTHMDKLFSNWANVQTDGWNEGVFYATDSNSADLRCFYSAEYQGYDCPGGWIDLKSGSWTPNSQKLGAGNFNGAGCHFNHHDGIDQTNARDASGANLVGNYTCECSYAFRQDWSKWIDQWRKYGNVGFGGKGASWAADLAACWLNNPRDMINLQNNFWWHRKDWNNQRVPQAHYKDHDAAANRAYWGWNEVPVNRVNVQDQSNWDAVMIKLPTAACGGTGEGDHLDCIDHKYQAQLEDQLDQWMNSGYLNHEIVIAREYMDKDTNYFRQFFCQSWKSPSGRYEIKYEHDKCTLEKKSTVVV